MVITVGRYTPANVPSPGAAVFGASAPALSDDAAEASDGDATSVETASVAAELGSEGADEAVEESVMEQETKTRRHSGNAVPRGIR